MKILAIDPGTSTGYCLINIDNQQKADIYEYGYLDVDTSSEYQGDHCLDLMKKIQKLIDLNCINHIAIEDYFFSKQFANGSKINIAFRTAIHILSRQNEIPYTILNTTSWKTFIAGRATPTKEQIKQWNKEAAKKLYIQQALWDKWKCRFPNHSISTKTHKPIMFRYDIVDVVAQGIYFCCVIHKIPNENINLSVFVPDDVIFKNKSQKQFIYPCEM